MIKIITVALVLGLGLAIVGAMTATNDPLATSSNNDDVRTGSNPKESGRVTDSERQSKRQYVVRVTIVDEDGGTTYRVVPTRRGRLLPESELPVMWREVVDRGVPDRKNLKQQFDCHPLSVVARFKSSWDLESWRPSVGLKRTLLSGCNPEARWAG